MEYMILSADNLNSFDDLTTLQANVIKKIKEGWIPSGSVCSFSSRQSKTSRHNSFCQAMIKKK